MTVLTIEDGHRRGEGAVPLEEAAIRCGQGGFVWLGLFEPGAEELSQVRDTFGLHELAVEDAQNFHMRPKIESYDQDVQLVILRTARYDDTAEIVEFGEISIFLAPTFVITVRQGVASELRGARQRLEQRPELLAAGSASVLWAVLDQAADNYAPVVAGARTPTSTRSRRPCSPAPPRRPSGSTRCAARPPTSTAPSTRCSPWSPPSSAPLKPRSCTRTSVMFRTTCCWSTKRCAERYLLGTAPRPTWP